jgi:CheY-like chemotaxis protein
LLASAMSYRLLIVEDQKENWLLLRQLLEGVGFSVRVAEDGAAGVETFRTWRPHLIWMDIRMPIMDGLEATRHIRALDGGQAVKIVALTASVFQEERDNVMQAGMDDFVCKPYRAGELFDCLRRQLDIHFVYETAPVAAAPPVALRPESFATLSPELRGELTDALVNLDTVRIGKVIRRIAEGDPVLGDALAQHAGQFGYTTILQALRAGNVQADSAKVGT